MNMSVREFIRENQRGLLPEQTCHIRISDIDGYEHLSFTLRKSTDLDKFNNVFDQQMLDADTYDMWDCTDEEGLTIFITADIEL